MIALFFFLRFYVFRALLGTFAWCLASCARGRGSGIWLCGSVLPAPRSGVAESATPFSVVTGALGLGLGVAFGCAFEVATTLAQVLPDCLALAKLPVALGVAVVPAPLTMARRPRMRSVKAKQNSEKKELDMY